MSTTRDIPRWLAAAHRDRADAISLHAYVDALPDAERVAFIYAHPTYCPDGSDVPAYVLHEVVRKAQLFGRAAGDKRLTAYKDEQAAQRLDALVALTRPTIGARIVLAIGDVFQWGVIGGILSAVGYVAGGPHLAAAGLTLGGAVGTIAVAHTMLTSRIPQ